MTSETPAYHGISDLDDLFLREAIGAAPRYDSKVALAIRRTIRCIHGLADLHETVSRDELEVYLGRATESTLASRWKSHARAPGRNHRYGCVLFSCDHGRVEILEDVAIRVLKKLEGRNALCVGSANIWPGSAGGRPRRNESALVYMTWRIREEVDWEKPSVQDIREIAKEVSSESPYVIKHTPIETGLKVLKRLAERDRLHWWHP